MQGCNGRAKGHRCRFGNGCRGYFRRNGVSLHSKVFVLQGLFLVRNKDILLFFDLLFLIAR